LVPGRATEKSLGEWRVAPEERFPYCEGMEVHLTPETEQKLKEFAELRGSGTDEVIEDALAGYFSRVLEVRETLDRRYDEVKSGKVKPIDGEEAFARLIAATEAQRHQRK
jgi:predicted transcriptional regulator